MQFDRGGEHANATNEAMMVDVPSPHDLSQTFEDGLSARALLLSMRRHPAIILAFTLSLCAAGYLVGLGLPAWYQAEGALVIHAQPRRTAEIQELPDPSLDLNGLQSEVDILKSRLVIEPVVRSLKLWEAPEFKYPQDWNWQIVETRLGAMWRSFWGPPSGPEDSSRDKPIVSMQPSDAKPPTQAQIDATVSGYSGYLTVGNDGHSLTMHVSYRALTPERAATIVNAHIDSYQNFGVKAKVAAAEQANAALTAQVTELRQQLLAAEAAVTQYREEHHLTGAAKDSVGQLASLHSQLISI